MSRIVFLYLCWDEDEMTTHSSLQESKELVLAMARGLFKKKIMP
jgi:hypothetical protein